VVERIQQPETVRELIIVPEDRERPPQPQRLFTASVQARFAPGWGPQPQFQPPAAATPQAIFQQALALHQQGRLAEAERAYREVLRQAPAHFDALHLLGVLTLQTMRTEGGVELIGQALALNPKSWAAHNNLGNGLRDLTLFDAALVSFDRSIALKPDFADAHNNRGIVLKDLKRLDDALASFDRAIALKSDYVEAHNNRGTVLQELNRFTDAPTSFDRAIALRPNYAEAYNNRGNTAKELGRLDDAVADFDRAIALRPDYPAALYNRGTALRQLGRFDDALGSFDRAVALKPDYAEAHNNRGLGLRELKRYDDAIASFSRAIALKPDYADAYANQSLSLLQAGRFEQGWPLYEWRKKLEQPFGNRSFTQPLWLGKDDISKQTLFVHWEQGFGDTMQFGRLAKLLIPKAASVVMSVQEPLYRLFTQACPGIEIIKQDDVPAAFDFHCPLLSLPLALGMAEEKIPAGQPYLFSDEELRKTWTARLPDKTKPRIGIVWSGGIKDQANLHRYIDLTSFATLLSTDAHWISLQKEIDEGDAATLEQLDSIAFYGEDLRDFSDTAAIIDHLDLVISVDTSVVHLAGAMGKPVWVLLPYSADWRWLLDRDDSPWYPAARLFRQDSTRSWSNVMARVREALDEFLQSHS
jgi:hypothetical protein